jgi:hypothetical protein
VDVEAPVPCSKFDEPDIIWACKVVDFTPTGNFAWSQRQVKLLSGGFFLDAQASRTAWLG